MTQEKVLSLEKLTMTFFNDTVLNEIDLDVYKGQIIGYIGPNGAGKSTTLKIMLGLLDGYRGRVEIFGQDIAKSGPDYKSRIGYVPENADLYDNLTALEYLIFSGELYKMTSDDAQKKARRLLDEFEMLDVCDTRLSSFSKGMRQKVLLIASMLHNPDLIFLDEPLNGLDANSVMIVKDVLEQLAGQGKTIFYSSHIMDVVEKISNRIVLLVDGQVAADGTFAELQEGSEAGSLEGIFNQLTGFDGHRDTARRLVDEIMDGDAVYEEF